MVDIPLDTKIRPSAGTLLDGTIKNFCEALVKLKNTYRSPTAEYPDVILSIYEEYVLLHYAVTIANPDNGHLNNAFLPWHREFIWRFESDLIRHGNYNSSLPYWDWSGVENTWIGVVNVEGSDPESDWDPQQVFTNMFRPEFMGGPGGTTNVASSTFGISAELEDGYFTKLSNPLSDPDGTGQGWIINPMLQDYFDTRTVRIARSDEALRRRTAFDYTVWDSDWSPDTFSTMQSNNYDQFRSELETHPHGTGHVWVGGHMVTMGSPMDPLFWLHHSQIDRLWYHWQKNRLNNLGISVSTSTNDDWINTYTNPANGAEGHKLDDDMWPWNNSVRQLAFAGFETPEFRTEINRIADYQLNNIGQGPVKVRDAINPFNYSFTYASDSNISTRIRNQRCCDCCSCK